MVFNTLSFQSPKNMKVNKLPDGLELLFLPDRSIGTIVCIAFLCVWLAGWLFGEVAVLGVLIGGKAKAGSLPFLLIWVTGWTIGGLFAFNVLLTLAFGKRIVTIRQDAIQIIESYGFWKKNNYYPMSRVRNLRRDSEEKMDKYGTYTVYAVSVDAGKIRTVLISSRDEKELEQPYELLRESGLFGPAMLSGYMSSPKKNETVPQSPEIPGGNKDEATLDTDGAAKEKTSEDDMYFPDIPDDLK